MIKRVTTRVMSRRTFSFQFGRDRRIYMVVCVIVVDMVSGVLVVVNVSTDFTDGGNSDNDNDDDDDQRSDDRRRQHRRRERLRPENH